MVRQKGRIMSTNEAQLRSLLQQTYFDNIDRGDADTAVEAFTEDVAWSHYQVWEHHGHMQNRADVFRSREEVREFLAKRIGDMQDEGIRHLITHAIVQDGEGAFRAEVVGVKGDKLRFFGWVELKDGKISRYIIGPEP